MVYELFDDTLRVLRPQQYYAEVGAFARQRLRQAAQLTNVLGRESLLRAPLRVEVNVRPIHSELPFMFPL